MPKVKENEQMSKTKDRRGFSEYENLAFHPYNVMLVFVMMAIGMLFFGIMVAFIYTRVENGVLPIRLPWLFLVSTAVLLACSHYLRKAKTAFENDEPALFRQTLVRTLWLTVAFLLVQVAAWAWLFSQNLDLKSGQGAGYLYLLSMLHFVHVLAGIPFLWLFLRKFNRQVQMELGGQLFFSDPEKRLQLRLVSMYWHFLDALWLLLVLFFLVNWLLQ
ncbi:MAG: cytochrome c oxidase subunit III [Bacteroidetes bacterium]|nr:MAG: cytochrome c oxidase subunit III [Bacteroidota bacterium]